MILPRHYTTKSLIGPAQRQSHLLATSFWVSISLIVCSASGCGSSAETTSVRAPRPVTVMPLLLTDPPNAAYVSASVGSWKQEDIGFEVDGRVEFVEEQNTEIEGRILAQPESEPESEPKSEPESESELTDEEIEVASDAELKLAIELALGVETELKNKVDRVIVEGTPIGRIDSQRFELQVQRAEAEITRAENAVVAALVELIKGIPAEIRAATASRNLAEIELKRSVELFEKRAAAESDVDRDKAKFESAKAQISILEATTKSKQAEVESLKSALLQAKQDLRDAERNLEDCTLYSSFRGQISEVSVVPGSVVTSGQPVATIQMMDPIKAELEVSAEQSRRLRKSDRVPIIVTKADGTKSTEDGFLYLIDPVADPLTRTFTITLLVMNEKVGMTRDESITARTEQTWRLDFKFLPGAEDGMLFVVEKALLKDSKGYFLWLLTNVTIGSGAPKDGKLKVRKMRVGLGPRKVPYLGNWNFQQVLIDDADFDPEKNMVAGQLSVDDGNPGDWEGDTIQLDSGGQWILRPGDLVKVDLSGENINKGFFVSMDSIVREADKSFLFVVNESDQETTAKRIPINVLDSKNGKATSGMRRIEAVEGQSLEGLRYIADGVHYLIDGEPVKVVAAGASE